ncbi:MAG: hypothetical protein SH809_02585 [Rhodothermales bacterium]|nr:hypothetical protein [Rhodothermales bacterium]
MFVLATPAPASILRRLDKLGLGSRPAVYTEVFTGIDDDNFATLFGVFGYFHAFKRAIGGEMSTEQMREGSITDADSGSAINLATQDTRALKIPTVLRDGYQLRRGVREDHDGRGRRRR